MDALEKHYPLVAEQMRRTNHKEALLQEIREAIATDPVILATIEKQINNALYGEAVTNE
jgi:cytochrome oxidase assembly protein ShyY1